MDPHPAVQKEDSSGMAMDYVKGRRGGNDKPKVVGQETKRGRVPSWSGKRRKRAETADSMQNDCCVVSVRRVAGGKNPQP